MASLQCTAQTSEGAGDNENSTPVEGFDLSQSRSWEDFCDNYAKHISIDFVKKLNQFLVGAHNSSVSISYDDVGARFTLSFMSFFANELGNHNVLEQSDSFSCPDGNRTDGAIESMPFGRIQHDTISQDGYSNFGLNSPQTSKKSFFRRLSFKGLRKGFAYKASEEGVIVGNASGKSKTKCKVRLTKIVVECIKEGVVNYLIGENLNGSHKWEKCKLILVKTAGGHILEFYSPVKSIRPKSGVFCSLIDEARATTALEMPDYENTFVLKADTQEYVIEAQNPEDMESWLISIRDCMQPAGIREALNERHSEGPVTVSSSNGIILNDSTRISLSASLDHTPDLPPRITLDREGHGSGLARPSSNTSSEGGLVPGGRSEPDLTSGELDVFTVLRDYPWWHGDLKRLDATQLVLQDGMAGHGVFLVRKSETRQKEIVLTFNFQGKAKHLRMAVSSSGNCSVQHLWFQTVFDMLEHFRIHPIPLESGGSSDVTLTEFVLTILTTDTHSPGGNSSAGERRPPTVPQVREVVRYGGSVRVTRDVLERQGDAQNSGSGRAVGNTYSFV